MYMYMQHVYVCEDSTLGSRSLIAALACDASAIIWDAYNSAVSWLIVGNLLKT